MPNVSKRRKKRCSKKRSFISKRKMKGRKERRSKILSARLKNKSAIKNVK